MLLDELIEEGKEIEKAAEEIQRTQPSSSSPQDIRGLSEKYRDWYTRGLSALPSEFHERFRREYEGSWASSKIKNFLESPTKPNPLFAPDSPLLEYWLYPFESAFRTPIIEQRMILAEARGHGVSATTLPTIELVEALGRRLPLFLLELARRQRNRKAFSIELVDEYDLQDLLRALLRIFFEDVRREEWTPSYAGGSSRIDFLLKTERTVVEAKRVRVSQNAKEIGDELILDIAHYAAHPECEVLVAIVYDPDRRIENPRGFERDLTRDTSPVRVFVAN